MSRFDEESISINRILIVLIIMDLIHCGTFWSPFCTRGSERDLRARPQAAVQAHRARRGRPAGRAAVHQPVRAVDRGAVPGARVGEGRGQQFVFVKLQLHAAHAGGVSLS